jgi:hypothetical protein
MAGGGAARILATRVVVVVADGVAASEAEIKLHAFRHTRANN